MEMSRSKGEYFMLYHIGIKDVVGNALIEIIERTGKRCVLFSELNDYIDYIKSQSTDDLEFVFDFNKYDTAEFIKKYAFMFNIVESTSNTLVELKSKYSSDDLRHFFRVNTSLDALKIFTKKDAINILMNSIGENVS